MSQQIRRLEEQLGKAMFRKEGRGLAPTEAGDVSLSYARRILDLNDEAYWRFGVLRLAVRSYPAQRWSTDYCIANGMDRPAQTTVHVRAWPASAPSTVQCALPKVDLFLHDGGRQPSKAVSRFKETLLETLRERLHLAPKERGKIV